MRVFKNCVSDKDETKSAHHDNNLTILIKINCCQKLDPILVKNILYKI